MFKRSAPEPSPQRAGPPRCSFCGKANQDVRQLVASERAMICDECVRICRDTICAAVIEGVRFKGASAHSEALGQCALCWEIVPIGECVSVPDHGRLCAPCREAVNGNTIRFGCPVAG